ncbi:MAG TPA: hypothetical protein VLB50_06365 [Ignavibacteriaceae bacterium]|nr:hypothetical protein [Ignavibacteriaceae bacterium]
MLKIIINKKLFLFVLFMLTGLINYYTLAGDIKGKVHLKGGDSDAGVLVYIENVNGTFPVSEGKIIMDQKDLMFIPSVLPILVGSTVTFLNNDNVLHNVFSPSGCARSFNLGTWPKGQYKTHTFTKADCFCTILCNVHPDMQAWIVVLQNPYFVKTDSVGNYDIKDLPEGNYILKIWYPFYKTLSEQIIIKGSGILRKNFTLDK